MSDAPVAAAELVAVAALWRQQKRELVARFAGVSMLPSIPAGTPLSVVCHGFPSAGEVILAIHRGQPLVHRLLAVSRDGRWFLTRGDANVVPDVPVPVDALIGRITGVSEGEAIRAVPALEERGLQRVARAVSIAAFRIGPRSARAVVSALWRLWWLAVRIRRAGAAARPS